MSRVAPRSGSPLRGVRWGEGWETCREMSGREEEVMWRRRMRRGWQCTGNNPRSLVTSLSTSTSLPFRPLHLRFRFRHSREVKVENRAWEGNEEGDGTVRRQHTVHLLLFLSPFVTFLSLYTPSRPFSSCRFPTSEGTEGGVEQEEPTWEVKDGWERQGNEEHRDERPFPPPSTALLVPFSSRLPSVVSSRTERSRTRRERKERET